jgi:hypothetical protein
LWLIYLDAGLNLSLGQSTVDAGCGLGGVTSHEGALLDDENIASVFQDGVGSRETGKASTNDDDLVRHIVICKKVRIKMIPETTLFFDPITKWEIQKHRALYGTKCTISKRNTLCFSLSLARAKW